jgi:ABC-type phosphate transport system substrate-binding protein
MNSSRIRPGISSGLAILVLALLATAARAGDFAVIVNKDNTSPVDKEMVARIYTGELKAWKDGSPVMAVDLPENSPVRASFSTEVLGKAVANVKALWAQAVFSGRALPPKQAASDEDVKKLVSANKGAIGYVKQSSVDDTVKAVLK